MWVSERATIHNGRSTEKLNGPSNQSIHLSLFDAVRLEPKMPSNRISTIVIRLGVKMIAWTFPKRKKKYHRQLTFSRTHTQRRIVLSFWRLCQIIGIHLGNAKYDKNLPFAGKISHKCGVAWKFLKFNFPGPEIPHKRTHPTRITTFEFNE